ncbi:MAG: TonB-dependent receptor [Terracidiphilus sp.]
MNPILRTLTSLLRWLPAVAAAVALCPSLLAQQTLGGITGEVTDPNGGAIPNVQVTAVGEQTALSRSVKTNGTGVYAFVNLPIGTYTLTFTADGFEAQKTPHITVQADRTATVEAQLKIGKASETIEVPATPLLNAVDTTNGYVMDEQQIEMAPLATGSFTGLAIQSTGVSAELNGGSGVNSGLGNAPIWANGQRDTSNTFLLNGVDASNLFNGKTTSQVASFRVINNTGSGNMTAGGIIQSSASIYLSVGNSIPSPAPETIEEVRVNASMYDAQQGATAGAHLDLSTKSGSNELHGSAYVHRGTNWINAAPFFFKNDPDILPNQKVPELHREIIGGTVGGALIKDKLFGFVGYQHLHVSDQELGYSRFSVPVGLSDDRSVPTLVNVVNNGWCPQPDPMQPNYYCTIGSPMVTSQIAGAGSNVALKLLTQPAVNGEPGKWLIPNQTGVTTADHPYNVAIPGTAYFFADQLVSDLDWNASAKDTLAVKYYYQHDPLIAPYAYSNVPGWAQHMDAGSQVFSVNNVNIVRSNLSVTETLGFIREKIYSTNEQPFSAESMGVNNLGSKYYSGVTIVDILGANTPTSLQTLNIGPGSNQGSLTGVFQNRWMPSANAIWTLGKHTIAVGGSWSHTQLNPRDRRPGTAGTTSSADFSQFVQGLVTANDDFNTTTFLQGNGDRYYRSNQTGIYLQYKFQIWPNLSLTAGVRFDNNGAFSEKYGHLYNFDPKQFNEGTAGDPTNPAGAFSSNGYLVAKDSNDTTLNGRQWGLGPRVGFAWSPQHFKNKVVVRGGSGFYYDRGELFTYLSPGYAAGEVHGGPFGVSQTQPFVNSQTCDLSQASYYQGYIPTCAPGNGPGQADLSNPWGTSLGAPPTGKASDITQYLPNAYEIANEGAAPFTMGAYDRNNKLPYSINYTLDVQWQPVSTLAIEIGYVGNVGRHQVIPTPFNQAQIASPGSPIRSQKYSYGYTLVDDNFNFQQLPDGSYYMANSEGGNVDLRVPYVGYSSESIDYRAAGVSQYNAAQLHVDKRLSHGFQAGASYTFSHATDEQSALGLFYNGDNPNNLRSGYGLADFDRKHVLDFTYSYQLPNLHTDSKLAGDFTNGWSLTGNTVLQSGQPFSVIDYSGSVGSVFYSTFDGINNPIVPLANGCTAKTAVTGKSGAYGIADAFFKPQCFTIPLLNPGDLDGAIPANDPYETTFIDHGQRNIFRQASQKSANISLKKETPFGERIKLRYTLDVFNLTNTTSLDVTGDNVTQNAHYNNFPTIGSVAAPTGCDASGNQTNVSFYNCPAGLGITTHTIGSPRQVQMSLRLDF